jgi:hypothetical protein
MLPDKGDGKLRFRLPGQSPAVERETLKVLNSGVSCQWVHFRD